MLSHSTAPLSLALLAVLGIPATAAAEDHSPAKLMDAQRGAMQQLAPMDGVWRGTAWTLSPSGEKHTVTQTERVGPFLNGTLKVIEGKGYASDGSVGFNAFAVLSYDPQKKAYSLRSYTGGRSGDFSLVPKPDGFVWEIPAGPATIRYTATIKDGTWREVGDRIVPGQQPMRFFEMNLRRIGDSEWPAGGSIPAK